MKWEILFSGGFRLRLPGLLFSSEEGKKIKPWRALLSGVTCFTSVFQTRLAALFSITVGPGS